MFLSLLLRSVILLHYWIELQGFSKTFVIVLWVSNGKLFDESAKGRI